MVEVPDARLPKLAEIVQPKRTLPAVVQFVDIAGLVKGAAEGEGLGNKFLANIRETDAIIHVVRCFEDEDVTHVMGGVDPVRDREVIEFELALADLGTVEKRLDRTKRAARTGDKEALAELPVLERAFAFLTEGRGLWEAKLTAEESALLKPLTLLTTKPVLYAANVSDGELTGEEGPHLRALRETVAKSGENAQVVPFSAKIEAELAELPPEDRADFLASLGLESAGLDRLIRAGYSLLGLRTYFTAGEQEVRAWTIHSGDTAPRAAGVIHTDFERGFIRAETVGYDDFVGNGGWKGARERGVVPAHFGYRQPALAPRQFAATAPQPADHRRRASTRCPAGASPHARRSHHPSCGVAASDNAIAWASRFQLAVSSPSRRRPAGVSR
jgi:GTP-binding protein YchF